nr:c-type cytochrome [uncultured Desulfuromonas sp.]
MKKTLFISVCLVYLITFSGSAFAAKGWRDGKKSYKSVCMNCHKRGGEAERLKLTQWSKEKWTNFFAEEKTGRHEEPWGRFSEKDKDNLLEYFHKVSDDVKKLNGCG